MRTTLTFEKEVAALIKSAMKKQKISLKRLINDAVKRGILAAEKSDSEKAPKPYSTKPHDAGRVAAGNVDNIGEVLSRFDEAQK